MCTNGVNTGQLEMMIDQIDDHIKLERRHAHDLGHLASDAGFATVGEKLHDVMHLLDEVRAALDEAKDAMEDDATEAAGFEHLNDAIGRYHLTERTGVDYPGEGSGHVEDFENWGTIVGYNVSFGQGISVTPLQMVRFYGCIANDGVMVTPHFLISKPQTGEVAEYPTEVVTEDAEALSDLRSMLRSVVTDGSGKRADVEGYPVCGKTSTAEVPSEQGGYKEGVYNLGFCGFIDGASTNLVCFVGANEVYGMRQTTKIFNDIMTNAVKQYNITTDEAK